jgi:lincosamide nucleotidyltransferase
MQQFPAMKRMDDLAEGLKAYPQALGLIGMGSVGLELDRLDQFSDLDFFLIVKSGSKSQFLENLSWLETEVPLDWSFRNTPDGYKVFWQDGVYGEFAIFEHQELPGVPYSPGRAHWSREGFDTAWCTSTVPLPDPPAQEDDYFIGEILSCLYVGLTRFQRGEKLSAWRFISGHAFSMILILWERVEAAKENNKQGFSDAFSIERRFETRHPDSEAQISKLLRGYEDGPGSALAMLAWVEEHYGSQGRIAREIQQAARGR